MDSNAAFTKELGIIIDAPEDAGDIKYSIIDNEIADISFVYNNTNYTLRASEKNDDFSGINGNEITSEQLDSENNAMLTMVLSDKTYLKLTWSDGEIQYILSCTYNESTTSKTPNSDIKDIYHTETANEIIDVYRLVK